jgi:predicted Zn finger-like uncharacterized protein
MILTCPACATRYQADAAKFPPGGRQVRCAKCGHAWHQPAPEPEAPALAVPELDIAFEAPAPSPESEAEPALPEEPMRRARAAWTPAPAKPRPSLLPMLGVALGWVGLIAVVLLIGLAAVRYRQEITVIWPQSAGVYSRLGMAVNTHGIDFVHVDYHRESEDGQVVLTVTGSIVNNGSRELPVPQNVRATLSDSVNHELYHWNFPPGVQTLKPGHAFPFTTRLSSPPASARHLEVRFAPVTNE